MEILISEQCHRGLDIFGKLFTLKWDGNKEKESMTGMKY